MNVSNEIRAGISEYLAAVGRNLSHTPPEEREEVLRELESHAYDALAQRVGDRQATMEDLAAVLAEMDPPESFARAEQEGPVPIQSPVATSAPSSVRKIMGWIALACIAIGLLLSIGLGFFQEAISPPTRQSPEDLEMHSYFGVQAVFWLAALILGLVSWRTIQGKIAVLVVAIWLILILLTIA